MHKKKIQSTGNFKKKRDKHQKTEHNKAKKRDDWVDQVKTNSERNKKRKSKK